MAHNPKEPAKSPKVMELEAGTYHWCSCGQSAEGDFCDGSHEGTEFTPVEFKLEAKTTSAICMCKRTNNPPFCDGSHAKLP